MIVATQRAEGRRLWIILGQAKVGSPDPHLDRPDLAPGPPFEAFSNPMHLAEIETADRPGQVRQAPRGFGKWGVPGGVRAA